MSDEFPKRLFKKGDEPLVEHINNRCRYPLMGKLEKFFPNEYDEVKRTSVFKDILAIKENSLGYSARLIHSMMCRQLVTEKKYEVWCVFGDRPLRFSLQEFYAVTRLKYEGNNVSNDVETNEEDNGFWSLLLKRKENISIKTLVDQQLENAKKWKHVDKVRFVYVCIIAGLIVAKDEKSPIPHKYIKLVMDISMVENYPWGRDAFKCLVDSIIKTREKLKNPKSYILDGFSYAFQIWIMDAIPIIGNFLAKKINNDSSRTPLCSNWTGIARASYVEINNLESTFQATDEHTRGMFSNIDNVSNSKPTREVENICGSFPNIPMGLDDVPMSPFGDMYQNLSTQEFLVKSLLNLSQDTLVSGFDSSQIYKEKREAKHISKPVKDENLKLVDDYGDIKTEDRPLVFVSEKCFNDLKEWSNKRKTMKFGPSIIDVELLTRIIGPNQWYKNEDMDAVMYLFRENTSLGRWNSNRVAFMDCLFSVQLKVEYQKFVKERRKYKWDRFMKAYGDGELPSHGKTGKQWVTDIDRIYTPVNINNCHWISLCINLIQKTIEVFDCTPNKKEIEKHVEPFKVSIPRILKMVLPPLIGKDLNLTPFSVTHAPVRKWLNKSKCDCGPYALKYIECHLLGLDISLLDDDNIGEAKMKLAFDIWQAAADPIFIDRMAKYTPTMVDSDIAVIELD